MLPIIPDPFKLVVRQIKTEDGYKADPTALKQLEVIRKLLGQADQVISCTDAGREGELIMRYVNIWDIIRKPNACGYLP